MSTPDRIAQDLRRVLWAWSVLLIVGALSVIVLAKPRISPATLALLLGISLIVRGLVLAVVAWALHRASRVLDTAARGRAAAT